MKEYADGNRPLRIRAHLQTRVISDQYLPLDGVLYALTVREKFGERDFSLPGENTVPEGASILLPFGKHNKKRDSWFYACSFAQWPAETVEYSDSYNKRFDLKESDLVDFRGKRELIDNSRGAYKSYHIKVYARHALYVDWYCTGAKAEIERLLVFATHLGKKTAQGEGAVLRWEVTEWPEDWSVRGPGNKLMRAVPARNGILFGLRPSYWLPRHQFNCKLP